MGSVSHVWGAKRNLVNDVHSLSHIGFRVEELPISGVVVHHNYDSSLVVE